MPRTLEAAADLNEFFTIDADLDGPAIEGEGTNDHLCPHCSRVVVKSAGCSIGKSAVPLSLREPVSGPSHLPLRAAFARGAS